MTGHEDNSSVSTALLVAGGIGCLVIVAVLGFLFFGFRASSVTGGPMPVPATAPVEVSEEAEPVEESEEEEGEVQPPSDE